MIKSLAVLPYRFTRGKQLLCNCRGRTNASTWEWRICFKGRIAWFRAVFALWILVWPTVKRSLFTVDSWGSVTERWQHCIITAACPHCVAAGVSLHIFQGGLIGEKNWEELLTHRGQHITTAVVNQYSYLWHSSGHMADCLPVNLTGNQTELVNPIQLFTFVNLQLIQQKLQPRGKKLDWKTGWVWACWLAC